MVCNITKRIKRKRYSILGHEKYPREIQKMCEGNPKIAKKYNKLMQNTKGNLYLLKNWISDALELNRQICYILAEINGSDDLYQCSNNVDLETQPNAQMLLKQEYTEDKINLDVHTHVVKQRTDKWFQLRKQAHVTGSSLYKAIGLDTLKHQKEHYNEFILCIDRPPFTDDVHTKLEHGQDKQIECYSYIIVNIYACYISQLCKVHRRWSKFHAWSKQIEIIGGFNRWNYQM